MNECSLASSLCCYFLDSFQRTKYIHHHHQRRYIYIDYKQKDVNWIVNLVEYSILLHSFVFTLCSCISCVLLDFRALSISYLFRIAFCIICGWTNETPNICHYDSQVNWITFTSVLLCNYDEWLLIYCHDLKVFVIIDRSSGCLCCFVILRVFSYKNMMINGEDGKFYTGTFCIEQRTLMLQIGCFSNLS